MYGILRFGVEITPEIAQFPLGDLALKVQYPHFTYSSDLVKTLWLTFGQKIGHFRKKGEPLN